MKFLRENKEAARPRNFLEKIYKGKRFLLAKKQYIW